MRTNNIKFLFCLAITVLLTLGLSISLQSLLAAWAPPAASPPACALGSPGCDEPLNISNTAQMKAGMLTLNTGGNVNGLIVDQGNVGIGENSPSASLHVSSLTASTLFRVDDSGAGDTSPFIVDGDGNVGIGIDSPAAKLHIVGTAGVDGIIFPDGTFQTTAGGAGGSLWTESGSDIYYDSGNVGIGTAAPGAPLQIGSYTWLGRGASWANPTLSITSAGDRIVFYGPTGTYKTAIGMVANNAVFIQAHGGTILELWGAGDSTEPTQKVTFKTNGNVGIGTAGPGRMLSLGEKAAQSAVLSFMDTDAVELGFVGVARATNDLVTGTTNTDLVIGGYAGSDIFLLDGTTINMVIKGNGNIGIGATNPGFKLQVTQPAADWTVHANGAGGYGLLATGSGYAGYFQGLIYGTSNLTVAGYATGQTGLCVGSDCRTSWPKLGSYSSRSWGTTYVAATDGFVAAHVYANSYQDSCDIDAKVWQGGAWNKVATAAAYHCGSAKCLVHHNSFTMPVSKGTSWLADKRNNYGSCEFTLQWIPLN